MDALRAIILTCVLVTATAAHSGVSEAQEARDRSPIFVTEDEVSGPDGCDAVSIFDGETLEPIHRGDKYVSPGRLAVHPQLSHAVASPSNGWHFVDDDVQNGEPFIYFSEADPQASSGWRDGVLLGAKFATLGAIALLPEEGQMLVATAQGYRKHSKSLTYRGTPPYRLVRATFRVGGPPVRRVRVEASSQRFDALPVEALLDPDGRTVHVVTADARLHSLDRNTLVATEAAVELRPFLGEPNPFFDDHSTLIHAIQSSDGRHIITNRWESPELNVVDVIQRHTSTVAVEGDVETIGGIAMSRAPNNPGVLAIHAGSKLLTYNWRSEGRLSRLGELSLDAEPPSRELGGPSWSLAWTEEGDRLIAAVDVIDGEFLVVSVANGGRELTPLGVLEACPTIWNRPNDIWTRNSLVPTHTPTPTRSATSRPTPTSTSEPTASATPTGTSLPSPTWTPTPTRKQTLTPTPAPIYLPILLRESCTPAQQRTDVALVVDASTSMLDLTAAGRPKLDAAIDAAGTFLDQLQLDAGDQASIVSFNADATLRAELTTDRASLDAALASITPASQTCLVCGVDAGADELASSRRRADNTPLLIVLTDGLSNPRPASEAVERAAEAKAAGVVIHTIGLGDTLDFDALEAMATEPDDFHRAPDGEDLAAIYAQIAVEIPCPPSRWWGRR